MPRPRSSGWAMLKFKLEVNCGLKVEKELLEEVLVPRNVMLYWVPVWSNCEYCNCNGCESWFNVVAPTSKLLDGLVLRVVVNLATPSGSKMDSARVIESRVNSTFSLLMVIS